MLKQGQLFQISEIRAQKDPVLYKLKDLMGDIIPGFYYRAQLTKTNAPLPNKYFFVEKILQTKKVKGEKFFLCKFLFYPNKFNMFVAEKDMTKRIE